MASAYRLSSLPQLLILEYVTGVLNYDVFLSLKAVLILANSADPDEKQHFAAFHLGLQCLGFGYISKFETESRL